MPVFNARYPTYFATRGCVPHRNTVGTRFHNSEHSVRLDDFDEGKLFWYFALILFARWLDGFVRASSLRRVIAKLSKITKGVRI